MTSLLLVEDDASHVELIRRALDRANEPLEVRVARGLGEARDAIAHSPPNVVLVDLALPDGNGLELIPEGHEPPPYAVIVMTSHGDEQVAVDAIKSGALDYVVKSEASLREMPDIVKRTLREWELIRSRMEAEKALQKSEERFRALYDDNPSMFFTVDADGVVRSVNKFGAAQLGYEVEELVGRDMTVLHPESDRVAMRQWLEVCMRDAGTVHRRESLMIRKDAAEVWIRATGRAVPTPEGASALLLVCEDITEARTLSERLSHQARHDPLTGLVNRWEFERRLKRLLETCRNSGGEHALCYLDLDQFKVINDTCGHVAGDELLRQIGAQLQRRIRRRDTLARLGGDEFGALLEHCSLSQARHVAGGLRRAISETRFRWEGKVFTVGVSIGVVPINAESESITSVMSTADTACYAAKDRGRNRIHVYHHGDRELDQRQGEMQWVARINDALEEDRFTLYYQPIARLKDGVDEGMHYEVLVRLRRKEGEEALARAFLGAAERYDLAVKIDRWVLGYVMEWLMKRPHHVERLDLCTINVSGQSVADEDFLGFAVERFKETGLPPSKLCFEITETAAIANLTRATSFINALRALGCSFSLDDFGSGLSSFAYLKTLPVDYLKIDGIFVKGVVDDPIDLAMVKSINDLGRVMGKKTIAEFVESEAILRKVKELGVDYAQGHYLGQPRPIEELA